MNEYFHSAFCVMGIIQLLWVSIRWLPVMAAGTMKEHLAEKVFSFAVVATIANTGCFFMLWDLTGGFFEPVDIFASAGYALGVAEGVYSLSRMCR